MKLIKMECPYCGASLEVPEGEKKVVCSYCGKTVEVDTENEKVITIKDEAKLKEAELKEKRYQDEKAEREIRDKKSFKKTKTGKLIIALIIIDLLAALYSFTEGKALAGIVALIQIILLVIAMLIGSGSIEKIKGMKIPYAIFLLIACMLAIPYFRAYNNHVREEKKELAWPSTELAKRLPEPTAKYGDVVINDDKNLDVDIEDYTDKKYQAYVDQCKKKGFTVDPDISTDIYEAADKDGYVLTLMNYSDSMSIRLKAPTDYKKFNWPVSSLAALLPAPPVNRGAIVTDTSTDLSIMIPDIDNNKFKDYANAVLAAGFNVDYKNSEKYFEGSNVNGVKATLHKQTGNVMNIHLESDNASTRAPINQATSAPTTAPATTGMRPEFKSAMDSYKATIDAYCEFMKSYDSSNAEMVTKYTKLYTQYLDTMSKLDQVNEQDLSSEEDSYFIKIMGEINQEILETGQSISQ